MRGKRQQSIGSCCLRVAVLGLLPKDLAVKLERFRVARHQVSRRILRMNKRLEKEFGEQVAEQRGWHWALTSFAVEAWNETGDT
jgi:hypothetical protein